MSRHLVLVGQRFDFQHGVGLLAGGQQLQRAERNTGQSIAKHGISDLVVPYCFVTSTH